MNEEVDIYIEKQPLPQKQICLLLRKVILKTFPTINEEMKNGVPSYGKYYIVGLKNSVNLGFSIQGLTEKDKKHFNGAGKFMRHLKFKEISEIDEPKIVHLLKLVDKKAFCNCS